jgi:hypothetical protein
MPGLRINVKFNHKNLNLRGCFSTAHRQIRQASLAFGPQHPAAHGILKLQLYLTGDTIR